MSEIEKAIGLYRKFIEDTKEILEDEDVSLKIYKEAKELLATSEIVIQALQEKQEREHISEVNNMRWISVNNRLPEYPGWYMVCIFNWVTMGYWDGGCWEEFATYHADGDQVKAWMEFPQPPKEG